MIAAPVNRIAHYEPATPAPLTPRDCAQNYSDTLQLAIATMGRLMGSFDPGMQFKAATAMFDLEKTRLRHHHPLAGTEPAAAAAPVDPQKKSDEEIDAEEEELLQTMVDNTLRSIGVKQNDKDYAEQRKKVQDELDYGTTHKHLEFLLDTAQEIIDRHRDGRSLDWPN
jgi:hypothetical protein